MNDQRRRTRSTDGAATGNARIDLRQHEHIRSTMKDLERTVSAHLKLPLADILRLWDQPHRIYHNLSHLDDLIGQIYAQKTVDRPALVLLALMHDVIADPRQTDNEDASIEFFMQHARPSSRYKEIVAAGIEWTKYQDTRKPKSEIIRAFLLMDLKGLLTGDMNRLLSDERKIFREYQWVDYAVYRTARPDILTRTAERFAWLLPRGEQAASISRVHSFAEYIRARRPNVGIYAGSFDPFHIGHRDILHQAERIFDKVIISVGMNPEKHDQRHWDMIAGERTAAIGQAVPFHQVEAFRGFLSDYLQRKAQDQAVTLIRGIRDGFDLRQEVIQLRYVQERYPGLQVIYIPCKKEYEHISSSWLRLLESVQHGSAAQYLCGPYQGERGGSR
jgi:pantetheine-phosphate adenylyltransferase